tara:strand:- start:615 stop:1163 length:549 start_codon:yes stop_codon:yes gene_type:complete
MIESRGYIYIKDFLTKDEINLFSSYTKLKHLNNLNFNNFESNRYYETVFPNDPLMSSLLILKKPLIENILKKELLPTYSFYRTYHFGCELKQHIDRPSCEYSCTVSLDNCGKEWPIYMGEEAINIKVGDALLYKGREIKHGRKKFEGNWHSQAFIHYVDKNGSYKEFENDKNTFFGEIKQCL